MNSPGDTSDAPTYHAKVSRTFDAPAELDKLAWRLTGPALVRFSGALWRGAEGPFDVLGCAVRLRRDARATLERAEDDQDIVFATVPRGWTAPLSPFLVDVHDYLANDYYARSPFDVGSGRKVYLRLHPGRSSSARAGRRADRLAREVRRGLVTLSLAIAERPLGPWTPLVTFGLERPADVDGDALSFLPHRDGRGVHPHGLLHAMRRGVDWVSQHAHRQDGAH